MKLLLYVWKKIDKNSRTVSEKRRMSETIYMYIIRLLFVSNRFVFSLITHCFVFVSFFIFTCSSIFTLPFRISLFSIRNNSNMKSILLTLSQRQQSLKPHFSPNFSDSQNRTKKNYTNNKLSIFVCIYYLDFYPLTLYAFNAIQRSYNRCEF